MVAVRAECVERAVAARFLYPLRQRRPGYPDTREQLKYESQRQWSTNRTAARTKGFWRATWRCRICDASLSIGRRNCRADSMPRALLSRGTGLRVKLPRAVRIEKRHQFGGDPSGR